MAGAGGRGIVEYRRNLGRCGDWLWLSGGRCDYFTIGADQGQKSANRNLLA